MADTPNQDDKKPTNKLGDIGTSVPDSITRALKQSLVETQKSQILSERLFNIEEEPLYKKVQRNPNSLSSSEVAIPYNKLIDESNRIRRQQEIIDESSRTRTASHIETAVAKSFDPSTIAGETSRRARTQAARYASLGMASAISSPKLQEEIEASGARLKGLEEEAHGLSAGQLLTGAGRPNESGKRLNDIFTEREKEIAQRTTMLGAARIHELEGLDPKSVQDTQIAAVMRAKATSTLDPSHEAGGKLIEAFDKLSEAAAKGAGNLEELDKNVEKTRKDFEESGGGKGGGNRFVPYLGAAAAGLGAIGGAMMQVGVNQRLAMTGNTAGLAGIENQKYQTYKAAAGGDVASLLMMGQFSAAVADGREIGKNARNAVVVNAGAEAVGAVGAGISGAAKGGATGGTGGAIAGAIAGAAGGIANATVGGFDFARDVTQNQSRVAMTNASLEARRQVIAVGAEQLQGFRDFSVGMGTAAIGMGGAGEKFLRSGVSDANLSRMAQARISPEQMAQMAQMGVASMGTMFNQEQVYTARGMEQRGLGTVSENMQRMAGLAAAGSNNPAASLGAITEAAVSKGLDSSKALNAVVDHTASMAAATSGRAMGLDTTAASAAMLMAGVAKDAPNKEAAIEHAATVQDIAHGISANIGANYAGMTAIARTQRTLGVSGSQAVAAQLIDIDTLKTINDLDTPAKKAAALRKQGVNVSAEKVTDAIPKMLRDAETKLLEAQGSGIILGNTVKGGLTGLQGRIDKANTLEDLDKTSPEDVAALGQIAKFRGMKGGAADMFGALKGVNATVEKETMGPTPVDDTKMLTSLDKLRTTGFEQLAAAAATGATALGGAAEAVDKLTEAFDGLRESMPATEKEATTAAGKSAAGGEGLDIEGFNVAIKNLGVVLKDALKKSNMSTDTSDHRQKIQVNSP